jgi:hypothetical protein
MPAEKQTRPPQRAGMWAPSSASWWFSSLILLLAAILLVVDLVGDGPEWGNVAVLVLLALDFVVRQRWRDPRQPWNK